MGFYFKFKLLMLKDIISEGKYFLYKGILVKEKCLQKLTRILSAEVKRIKRCIFVDMYSDLH